jgi:hypothetical protein
VEVTNGQGASITSHDPKIASVRDPANPTAPLTQISTEKQTVEIVGNHRGGALIVVDKAHGAPRTVPANRATLTVSVKEWRSTKYTPTMTPHDHRPVGMRRWKDMLKVIEQPASWKNTSGAILLGLCKVGADPRTFVDAAIAGGFYDKPIALKHLNWYLQDGRGQEFNEDDNIAKWVRSDEGLRKKVRMIIMRDALGHLRWKGHMIFYHSDYADSENNDFYHAFGTIDRLDLEVDWVLKTVKLWFMDSYEWHPICKGFYKLFPDDPGPDGGVRPSNSLHAALVELKDRGAADFWMVGEATLPLSAFGFPA